MTIKLNKLDSIPFIKSTYQDIDSNAYYSLSKTARILDVDVEVEGLKYHLWKDHALFPPFTRIDMYGFTYLVDSKHVHVYNRYHTSKFFPFQIKNDKSNK